MPGGTSADVVGGGAELADRVVQGGEIDGAGPEEPLASVAAEVGDFEALFFGLDAFGYRGEVEVARHVDDRVEKGASLLNGRASPLTKSPVLCPSAIAANSPSAGAVAAPLRDIAASWTNVGVQVVD
jgi:hypothetical protein